MMKTVFKAIQFETMPKYIRGLFEMRNTERNLRGSKKLVIPYVNTTTYSLHSFRFTCANMSNNLTKDLRSLTSVELVQNYNMPNFFRTSMQLLLMQIIG